ncbi:MAG: hypothetical protein LBN00_00475 [Oscillospiraceae bacterium]|jgi:uncharacterized membrane protein YcgQ (UPF0703/DUF1980 family)|nr:hypothetical protein [Oscillospiraceae bacterium]
MKKVNLPLIAAALIIALSGCRANAPVNAPSPATAELAAPQADNIIEIKEKMFVAQTNEIYINTADYLGRTIKYEGIFQSFILDDIGEPYYSVIRYGPGCCGTDGDCGFEVIWDGAYPGQDDWVEVVGVLEEYDEDGYTYLRLALTSLTVLDTRGEEYVTQ